MGVNRALVGYELDGTSWTIALLDVSGSTPSVLDTANHPDGYTPGNAISAIDSMTSTKAVWYTDDNDGSNENVIAVDITGDSISFGSSVNVSVAGETNPSIVRLTDTSGAFLDQRTLHYFTISGTTITVEDTITFATTGSPSWDKSVSRVSDTEMVVFYEDSGTGPVNAKSYEWSGSALSLKDTLEVFSGRVFTQDNRWSFELKDRHIMALWQDLDDANLKGVGSVVAVNLDGTLSEPVSDVDIFTGIQPDHMTGDTFPNGDFAISVAQDETTTPVKQGIAKVISP